MSVLVALVGVGGDRGVDLVAQGFSQHPARSRSVLVVIPDR
jgi:hypothetical protein